MFAIRTYFLVLLLPLILCNTVLGQDQIDVSKGAAAKTLYTPPIDTPWKSLETYKKLVPNEVIWSARIWRRIDLRDEHNIRLFEPLEKHTGDVGQYLPTFNLDEERWSLWFVIRYLVQYKLSAIAYYPKDPQGLALGTEDGDSFKYPCYPRYSGLDSDTAYIRALNKLFTRDQFMIWNHDLDSLNNDSLSFINANRNAPIVSEDIIAYEIKEDWYFNKGTGEMERRILGIAPVVQLKDQQGNIHGTKVLFWLYYPHVRDLFHKFYTYKLDADEKWYSYAEYLEQERYQSTVVRENNSSSGSVKDRAKGRQSLQKGEEAKGKVNKTEENYWEY